MNKELHIKWPTTVTIPNRIGCYTYYNPDDRCCCAMGEFVSTMYNIPKKNVCNEDSYDSNPALRFTVSDEQVAIKQAYIACYLEAKAERQCEPLMCTIVRLNDSMKNEEDRVLVYAATWAVLGYELVGYPKAKLLAKKAMARLEREKNVQDN